MLVIIIISLNHGCSFMDEKMSIMDHETLRYNSSEMSLQCEVRWCDAHTCWARSNWSSFMYNWALTAEISPFRIHSEASSNCSHKQQYTNNTLSLLQGCCFPSVLWHCWLGDIKCTRPVKKLGVGFLVVTFWLDLCMSHSSSCHHSPPPSHLAPIQSRMETFQYWLTQVRLENGC